MIPDLISLNLMKLIFHRQILKANKWIKNSLLCKIEQDFNTYMQTNKSFLVKESILYQKILKEEKYYEMKGFIDPAMKAAL